MKRFTLGSIMLCLCFTVIGQVHVPYFGNIEWVSGYANQLSGENISYFSVYPEYAQTALLTRASGGNKSIEWETAPVPRNLKGKYVYFSWVAAHSSGTSSGPRNFDLYVNDKKLLTFTTFPAHQQPDWIFTTPDSAALVFQQLKRDGANDAHGLAFLRLPKDMVEPGMPVKLKVVGQAQNSNDWYMTFKFRFEEKVEVTPMPFVLKNGLQVISLTALHFGADKQLNVKVDRKNVSRYLLKNGINRFDIPVRAVIKPDSVYVSIMQDKKVFLNEYVKLNPVTKRVLHFIHHSHTDIGYSHLQSDVLKIHLKNIDDALSMINKTRNYPAEARFRWNIESLWPVEEYLKQADKKKQEEFINAVKEGSICLSGLYANVLTGMSLPEETFHYTDYAEQLRERFGVMINSAMISDIPGYAWTTVTALAKGGVRYFSSGPNYLGENHPYGGDRVGHFDHVWGDQPVWWSSPSGKDKILFWTAGKGYSSWHGTAPGAVFERAPAKIAAYLNELDRNNYPYEMVQWRYNIVADNGPIDSTISDFVQQWNKTYASPKIILNTTDKMFEEFESRYGNNIPVVKGDISPYWEDGAMSTAAEEGANRTTSNRLTQLTNLYSMINQESYDAGKFYEAWKNVILFHEHTWGAHNSISEPDVPFVTEQWKVKKQFMQDALEMTNQIESGLLHQIADGNSKKIMVFNTLSWNRSGPVIFHSSIDAMSVKDSKGKLHPVQKLSNGDYAFIAENVPALGSAEYALSMEVKKAPSSFAITHTSLKNDQLEVGWDKYGSIVLLKDKEGINYAGNYHGMGLNSYWYVNGKDPSRATTNKEVKVQVLEEGPVLCKVSFKSVADGVNRLEQVLTLYAGADQLMIENVMDKKAIREKEAVHFGFPFDSTLNIARADAGYGIMKFLGDQLPGSNMDFLCARRWLDVSNAHHGIQLMSLQAPMMEPGNMIDEQLLINNSHKEWKKQGQATATWFSYAMNNYWHTNYKADQGGIAKFNYALRPHRMFSYSETEKRGAEYFQPLVAVAVKDEIKPLASLFETGNEKVLITGIVPSGKVFIIRVFNPEPVQQEFILANAGGTIKGNAGGTIKAIKVSRGKSLIDLKAPIQIGGMELMELEIETGD